MKLKFFFFITLLSILVGCESQGSKLEKAINKAFRINAEVIIEEEDIVIQITQLPLIQPYYLNDYQLSRVVEFIKKELGVSVFKSYRNIRFDVSSLRKSFYFPTTIVLNIPEKLDFIKKVVEGLNLGDKEALRLKFDDVITDELFEEQILKEWNGLMQINSRAAVSLKVQGYDLKQLPSAKDYLIQFCFTVEDSEKSAFVEFLYEESGDQVMMLNITLL